MWHAMLRSSPSESTFSCVLALMFTQLSCTPIIATRLALIAALCGLSLGFCAMMVASRLPISYLYSVCLVSQYRRR